MHFIINLYVHSYDPKCPKCLNVREDGHTVYQICLSALTHVCTFLIKNFFLLASKIVMILMAKSILDYSNNYCLKLVNISPAGYLVLQNKNSNNLFQVLWYTQGKNEKRPAFTC